MLFLALPGSIRSGLEEDGCRVPQYITSRVGIQRKCICNGNTVERSSPFQNEVAHSMRHERRQNMPKWSRQKSGTAPWIPGERTRNVVQISLQLVTFNFELSDLLIDGVQLFLNVGHGLLIVLLCVELKQILSARLHFHFDVELLLDESHLPS